MFEDDGLFTPCRSDMEGTEGVNDNEKDNTQSKFLFLRYCSM